MTSTRIAFPKTMTWRENPIEEPIDSGCRHHWVIEPADGPLSEGVCQKCGGVKKFTNYMERNDWSYPGDSPHGPSRVGDLERSLPERQDEDETAEAS